VYLALIWSSDICSRRLLIRPIQTQYRAGVMTQPAKTTASEVPKPVLYVAAGQLSSLPHRVALTSFGREVDVRPEDTTELGVDDSDGERGGTLGLPGVLEGDKRRENRVDGVQAACDEDARDVCGVSGSPTLRWHRSVLSRFQQDSHVKGTRCFLSAVVMQMSMPTKPTKPGMMIASDRWRYLSVKRPHAAIASNAMKYGGADIACACAAVNPMFLMMVGSVKLKAYRAVQ